MAKKTARKAAKKTTRKTGARKGARKAARKAGGRGHQIVFAGVGFLLDRLFKTTPILTVVGTLVGAGLAFFWVYQKVKTDEARYKAEHKPPPPGDEG